MRSILAGILKENLDKSIRGYAIDWLYCLSLYNVNPISQEEVIIKSDLGYNRVGILQG